MRRIISLVLAAMLLGLIPATALAARPTVTDAITIPVTGTVGSAFTFAGNFDINRFASQGGQLVAVGTLTGTLTNVLTGATQAVSQIVTLPIGVTATCDILHLELGPLDLDLLGLVVHLDRVVLDIDAEAGPGNLLGNLLCAVAGLLDGGGPLGGLAQLLNQILRILG